MNDLQIFNNEEFGTIRSTMINGEPWFVGKDVAKLLGYANSNDALAKHVDEEDRGVAKCDTLGGIQELNVINESGLYSLILRSSRPEAKRIQRWVTSEVLPTLRKTGSYSLQAPKTYAEALRALADEAEKAEALQKQNLLMQPKAEFFDAVAGSKTAISLGEVAKVLDMGIGRNKLFEILRQKHILMRNNQPYQQYVDMGYFRVIEQKYEVHGEVRISIKTLVYQKGIDWIRKQLSKGV